MHHEGATLHHRGVSVGSCSRALTDFVTWSCVDYLSDKGSSYRVVLGNEVQFVQVNDLTNLRFVDS